MRVLHLIDGASPQATSTTLALLNESFGRPRHVEQQILLLGGRRLRRTAFNVGIRRAWHLGVPSGISMWGWSPVRQAIRCLGPFDLLHCWSIRSLTLATFLYRATPRLLTVTVMPSKRAIHWMRILSQHIDGRRAVSTVFLPISNTIRRELLGGGVVESFVHALRPGLDLGKVNHSQRSDLRNAWGCGAQTKVLALLSDPPMKADAVTANMVMTLAAGATNPKQFQFKLLMHTRQLNRRRAQRTTIDLNEPERNLTDDRLECPWQVLPGCDYVLAMGPDAGGLSLLWAMAANVPVVGEASYAISEILEDRHSALLARPNQLNALAKRVCQLIDDPHLTWQLRDMARHEAYSYFSRQRYCQSLNTVYEQLVKGCKIEVPPMEITGGLRFSGL